MSVIFILMEWWINKFSEVGFQETFKFLSRSAFIPQRKPFGVGWARIKFTAPIFLSFPKPNRPAHLSVRTISLCCKKFFPKTCCRKSRSMQDGATSHPPTQLWSGSGTVFLESWSLTDQAFPGLLGHRTFPHWIFFSGDLSKKMCFELNLPQFKSWRPSYTVQVIVNQGDNSALKCKIPTFSPRVEACIEAGGNHFQNKPSNSQKTYSHPLYIGTCLVFLC